MAVDDIFTVEDYAKRPDGRDDDALHRVHQLLLQKGSKGADWGAKPVLNFMIELLGLCMRVLKEGGKRSRMLATWYEEHPTKLYLPPALEDFRGEMIDRSALWQIINLTDSRPTETRSIRCQSHLEGSSCDWKDPQSISNPRALLIDGTKNRRRPTVQAVAWEVVELILLRRVARALDAMRRVTQDNTTMVDCQRC